MLPRNRFNSASTPAWNEVEDFCAAAKSGNVPLVSKLLDQHGKAILDAKDARGDTALTWAAWGGYAETVALLLDRGAGIDVKGVGGKTALAWAADGGKKDIVALLLTRGASPAATDDNGDTPVKIARGRGYTAIATQIETFIKEQKEKAAHRAREDAGRALAAERLEQLKKNKPPRLK